MTTQYRVTPKRNKWIVQRVLDRKTCGKPFRLKNEALAYKLKLDAKAPKQTSGITVHPAYKQFVEFMDAQSGPGKRRSKKYTNVFKFEYDLRISLYMEDKLLSEIDVKDMENYLTKAHDAGFNYKTLKNSVKFFKQFLKRQVIERHNPRLDIMQFQADSFGYILPKDDDLMFKKETARMDDKDLKNLLAIYYQEASIKPESAQTFALFCIMFFTGLRIAEVQGLKKSAVDMENKLLYIKGVYNPAEGGFLNKVKNKASKRPIELDVNALKFFDWYLPFLDKHSKHNVYLIPSPRTEGPTGYKYIRTLFWKAYARMGLAEIKIKNGYAVVISSAFKGSPTKSFRHKFCTALTEAMNSNPLLTANYVKQSAGHGLISTTRNIYGNKPVQGTQKERDARAAVKAEVLNTNIIPIPKLISSK